MTTGEEWNKDWFKNWQKCSVWKLPFYNHRAIKLMQNCICLLICVLSPCSILCHSWTVLTLRCANCASTHMHSCTRQFAQCYLILTYCKHTKFYTVHISHSPFNDWNASLFVCLHGCAIACT